MLRKILTTFALVFLGIFLATNGAIAAPTPYPPPPAVAVAVNTTVVPTGGSVDFTGSGYQPGELVRITVYYRTASGALVAGGTYEVRVDANGNFSLDFALTQAGMATLSAYGESSGRTGTLDVSVRNGSPPTSEGTTTVPGAPNETVTGSTLTINPGGPTSTDANGNPVYPPSTDANGNPVYPTSTYANGNPVYPAITDSNGNPVGADDTEAAGNPIGAGNAPGDGDSGIGSGGLASTGASIAGPLTVGAGALLAGLALLFFGTRLATRRRSGSSTQH